MHRRPPRPRTRRRSNVCSRVSNSSPARRPHRPTGTPRPTFRSASSKTSTPLIRAIRTGPTRPAMGADAANHLAGLHATPRVSDQGRGARIAAHLSRCARAKLRATLVASRCGHATRFLCNRDRSSLPRPSKPDSRRWSSTRCGGCIARDGDGSGSRNGASAPPPATAEPDVMKHRVAILLYRARFY